MSRSIQTETFVDSLFAKRTGVLVAAYGINGQSTPNGGYTFEGRLRHRYFEWPRERERFLKWAIDSFGRFNISISSRTSDGLALRRRSSAKEAATSGWTSIT